MLSGRQRKTGKTKGQKLFNPKQRFVTIIIVLSAQFKASTTTHHVRHHEKKVAHPLSGLKMVGCQVLAGFLCGLGSWEQPCRPRKPQGSGRGGVGHNDSSCAPGPCKSGKIRSSLLLMNLHIVQFQCGLEFLRLSYS